MYLDSCVSFHFAQLSVQSRRNFQLLSASLKCRASSPADKLLAFNRGFASKHRWETLFAPRFVLEQRQQRGAR